MPTATDRVCTPTRLVPHWPFATLQCGAFKVEAPLTDRLSLTNALADADIDRQKAERIATEIFDAIHDNVATKQDLELVRADLARAEQRLNARIELVQHQLMTRLGGLMVVLSGLLFAALHYWPPAHAA